MSSPYDLVSPVLPQALRLARYQALAKLPQNVSDLQSENDTINQMPSREEERLLVCNADVMVTLENLFSRSEKDRTNKTSKLSHLESVRFQRAMYRIWLMSVLFGLRRFDSSVELASKNLERKSDLDKSWKGQKSFLQQFSAQELSQIDGLAAWLIWMAQWAVAAEQMGSMETRTSRWHDLYNCKGLFLFAGPHAVLRCYEEATTTHLPKGFTYDDGPCAKFMERALSEILQRRATELMEYVGVILDNINGEHDRCRHCGSAGAPWIDKFSTRRIPVLYNESNWDRLKGRLNQSTLLPYNLSLNLVEESLLQGLSGNWSRLLHEMFACRGDWYAHWSKEDWVCNECWTNFFRDTIWRWRLLQKKKAKQPIERDCKYGYHCKEQCHESGLAHAKRFNHLCKPIEQSHSTRRVRR